MKRYLIKDHDVCSYGTACYPNTQWRPHLNTNKPSVVCLSCLTAEFMRAKMCLALCRDNEVLVKTLDTWFAYQCCDLQGPFDEKSRKVLAYATLKVSLLLDNAT